MFVCVFNCFPDLFGILWNTLYKGRAIMMCVFLMKVLMQKVPQMKAMMLKVQQA